MSADDGIIVEFEVLPPAEGEPSAKEVLRDLHKQLRNPSSRLRSDASPFGRFARLAQLSTDDDDEEEVPVLVPVPVQVQVPVPAPSDEVRVVEQPPVETPDGLAKLSKLSNSELIERIHTLERELTRTAAKKPVVIQEPASKWRAVKTQTVPVSAPTQTAPVAVRSEDVEEMDSRLMQMRRLLEEKEKELREAEERSTTFERRSEQVEQRLKEREQLLAHAKKMWMQETERSSAYEKKLSEIEKKYADQEKQSSVVNDSYNAANNAVQQLHQFVGANEGLQVPKSKEFDSWSSMRMTQTGGLAGGAKPAVHQPRPPNFFDSGASQPRSAPSLPRSAPQAQGGEQVETNAERFRRLCVLNNAVLHEDELLQIGVKAEFSGREGQLSVFFGNKCNAALQSFTVQYFVREERSLRFVAAPVNTHLEARDQIPQRLTVTLLEPFVEPPWMRVQFLLPDTSPRRLQIRLPIVLTKFMRGRELAADDFFRYWRQHSFVLNEVSSVVYLAARFQSEESLNRRSVAKALLFNGAMFLHSGIDSNSENFVLASQLNPPALPAFDVQFGSLGEDREGSLTVVRVEMGSGRFAGKARVVVRSSDNTTARAVCEGIVAQLVEPGARATGGVLAH